MIIIGLILAIFAAGFCCWLLFTLAIYAFPLFMGVAAWLAALDCRAGIIGATLVGFVAAAITLILSHMAFKRVTSPIARSAVTLLFAAPAAFAGYHATLGLAALASRQIFGVI
jgi:hypothetical protein